MYYPKQIDIVFLVSVRSLDMDRRGEDRAPSLVMNSFLSPKFAAVCPITNISNNFPLHIPLDNRTKTTGMILTEHMKCLDVVSRNIQFVEKLPDDLTDKTLSYVKAFF